VLLPCATSVYALSRAPLSRAYSCLRPLPLPSTRAANPFAAAPAAAPNPFASPGGAAANPFAPKPAAGSPFGACVARPSLLVAGRRLCGLVDGSAVCAFRCASSRRAARQLTESWIGAVMTLGGVFACACCYLQPLSNPLLPTPLPLQLQVRPFLHLRGSDGPACPGASLSPCRCV
jgi:hypothetical protein